MIELFYLWETELDKWQPREIIKMQATTFESN